jgi:hypothetical protein
MMKVKWMACLLMAVFALTAAAQAQEQNNAAAAANQAAGQAEAARQDTSQSLGLGQDASQPAGLGAEQPAARDTGAQSQLQSPPAPDRSLIRGDQSRPAQLGDEGQAQSSPEGDRGELGILLMDIEGPGVAIRRVTDGSAADQAGLESGDVLMQVNGQWISSPDQAAQMIREMPVGQTARLQIWRNDQPQEIAATIGEARRAMMREAGENADEPYRVGFRGEGSESSGNLSQRIMRLEQQLAMLRQELQQLRQQRGQSNLGPDAATGIQPQPGGATAAPGTSLDSTTSTTDAPPSGLGAPGTDATQSDLGTPVTDATQPGDVGTPDASGAGSQNQSDDLLK